MRSSWKIVAKTISRVFHPVFVFPAVLILLFGAFGDWQVLAVVMLLSFVLPFGYMFVQLKRGKLSDFDITKREERYAVYGVSFVGMLLSLGACWLWSETALFEDFLLLFVLALVLIVVNFKVKASVHVGLVMILAAVLVQHWGLGWWVFVLAFPVAWSRVLQKKHSLLEVCVGALIALPTVFI